MMAAILAFSIASSFLLCIPAFIDGGYDRQGEQDQQNDCEALFPIPTVPHRLLQSPKELFALGETSLKEGDQVKAILCWRLLHAIDAPWEFRGRALCHLAKYYHSQRQYREAYTVLKSVAMQQENDDARKEAIGMFRSLYR